MTYAENNKVNFDYEIMDTYEGGIKLLGFETKAVRLGMVSLTSSRCIIRGGEIYAVGIKIDPYQPKNIGLGYDPLSTRKVLLHKKEIYKLERDGEERGYTIIPLSLFKDGRKIKISIALCRGKKSHDKRETIKKRETDRNLQRDYKLR
jgi:SsrA-binding protein